MKNRNLALILFLAVSLAGFLLVRRAAPDLPDRVAVHFGISGEPDGWGDRADFVKEFHFLNGMMVVVFLGCAWLIGRLDPRWVNLPNKDHWLAPERAAATRRVITAWLLWLGVLTQGFLLYLQRETLLYNLGEIPACRGMAAALAVFLVLTMALSFGLILVFAQRPARP